jgi:3'-phosphoadenosine 5'-phosphosulfate (PAPS) 3'-phosphatase
MNPSPRTLTLRVSEVTEEDKRLGGEITDFLSQLTDSPIPVIQEEAEDEQNMVIFHRAAKAKKLESLRHSPAADAVHEGSTYWVVDPIDGTGNFINPESRKYGILIGLVKNGQPVFGMTFMPESDLLQYVGADGRAWQESAGQEPQQLQIQSPQSDAPLRLSPQMNENHLHANEEAGTEDLSHFTRMFRGVPGLREVHRALRTARGIESVLKRFSTGGDDQAATADCYDEIPMLNGACDLAHLKGGYEWDYAGRHAILKAAGAEMYDEKTLQPLTYTNFKSEHGRDALNNLYQPAVVIAQPETLRQLAPDAQHTAAGRAAI